MEKKIYRKTKNWHEKRLTLKILGRKSFASWKLWKIATLRLCKYLSYHHLSLFSDILNLFFSNTHIDWCDGRIRITILRTGFINLNLHFDTADALLRFNCFLSYNLQIYSFNQIGNMIQSLVNSSFTFGVIPPTFLWIM